MFILLMLPSDGRFDGWISRWIAKALPSCCMATALTAEGLRAALQVMDTSP